MDKQNTLYHLALTLSHSLTPKIKRNFLEEIGSVGDFFELSDKQFNYKLGRLKLKKTFEGRSQLIKQAENLLNTCKLKKHPSRLP